MRLLDQALGRRFFYRNTPIGRARLQESWGSYMESPDFPEKFLRLTSGLDAKSCGTVVRILTRMRQAIDSRKSWLDFYTQEEQEELRLLREGFDSQILEVSDGLFAWRNYLLPDPCFRSSVLYYRHGLSTLKTLDTVKGKAVIDAGGCNGDSVLVFAELGPSSIHTFEPVPENFALLKRTLELNRVANAVPENVALGAERGEATMSVNGGSSSIIKDKNAAKDGKCVAVPVRTLDGYVEERGLQVGLIKTDLEGSEPAFLAGAKRTICGQRPILLVSIYHNPHDFFEIKPLIESWGLGYRFSVYRPTIGGICAETLLIGEVDGSRQPAAGSA